MEQVVQRILRFDRFALDMARSSVRTPEQELALRPKTFEVLRYLAENAGRVVSKHELHEALWPNVAVTDNSLEQCVRELRDKLADGDHRLIKTVSRRGYMLDAQVAASLQDTGVAVLHANGLALPDRPSLAVLPLENLSGKPEQDYFAEGITDDIITELSRFSDLFVIARNSSFQYKGKTIDVRQVGRELGVRYVLEGSIRRDGRRVRITAQLVDAVTGAHRWAERYDRQLEDVFAVQDEVARTIASILSAHVSKAEIERTLNKPPVAWQAYDCYLRAVHIHSSYHASFKATDLYEVRRLLEQALAIDPKHARACVRLARTYLTAWVNALDSDHLNPAALDQAYQTALKAVQLDPNLPEAQAVLAHTLSRRGEHDAAIGALERAVALNPNFTDWRFGDVLVLAGEPARAIEALQRHMRLDPFYPSLAPCFLGAAYYLRKQYSQALPPLRECVARSPSLRSAHVWLAAVCARLGKRDEARAQATEVLRIDPEFTIAGKIPRLWPFRRTRDAEHVYAGLRRAGLPER